MSQLNDFLEETQQLLADEVKAKYSEQVLDHWLHPRNPGSMRDPDGHAQCVGECGDVLEIYLRMDDNRIVQASFVTDGCITSIVAGSMAVELATSRKLTEVMAITSDDILDGLGGLPEESEHCASLAAETLHEAALACARGRVDPWKRLYRT